MKLERQNRMKQEQQLLINRGNEARTTTTDQQGIKLEQQLLIREHEARTTTIDQQGMNLEQHGNYWPTGNEVKLEQQILINGEWS